MGGAYGGGGGAGRGPELGGPRGWAVPILTGGVDTPRGREALRHVCQSLVGPRGTLRACGGGAGAPSDVHGRHTLPGTGLRAVSLYRVEAAGAIVAASHVEGSLQHRHPC